MCTRYSLTSPQEATRTYFRCVRDHAFPPRYNIAPTQPVSIVRTGADNARELVLVRWGLIPGWVKDPNGFGTLLNARTETALEKASFKVAMRHRRCLIPADAYYEWTGTPGAKRPHMIARAGTPSLFAMAGLWEHWMGAEGSEMETMAILTVAANATTCTLGDRMPAIVPESAFDRWLDVREVRDREAWELLRPAPADLLRVTELLPAINDPRCEGADLQIPAHARNAQAKPPTFL